MRPTPENSNRVFAALLEFGAAIQGLTHGDLACAGTVFQIGVAPRRIDFLTSIDGVEFGAAWQDRETREVDGVSVPVLSRPHLLLNKRATGRPKDQLDAEWLERGGE